MTREDIKQKLIDATEPENLKDLNKSMELLSTEDLHMCLDTFESRKRADKTEKLIGLQVNKNNTIDVNMETPEGKFYGVSIIL